VRPPPSYGRGAGGARNVSRVDPSRLASTITAFELREDPSFVDDSRSFSSILGRCYKNQIKIDKVETLIIKLQSLRAEQKKIILEDERDERD
jgi:hypothetical protein